MEILSQIAQRFNQHKICVLIPTYNNAKTLSKIINDVLTYTNNVIVVNDGSTDDTSTILTGFHALKTVSYTNNVGKGWALRKGFKFALEQGYVHQ